ncbi:MAG: glyoxalase [Candidatus Sericytochromatia bacterium]
MNNFNSIEIKVFLPSKNFEISKQFYLDLGFIKASDSDGIAYFYHDNCSFLLQDFYEENFANNLMMHFLVEDISSWHKKFIENDIENKYGVKITEIKKQPWNMLDFIIYDPSGVLWRFAQNI